MYQKVTATYFISAAIVGTDLAPADWGGQNRLFAPNKPKRHQKNPRGEADCGIPAALSSR